MKNFDFYNPVKIVFGKDRIGELNKLVPQDAKVLVLYGGGSVKKYGTLDQVLAALGQRSVKQFEGIEPNPQYETLMKAVAFIKQEGIDFLLAVGGGSVIDGTKFIALAHSYEGDPTEILRVGGKKPGPMRQALPLGTVLTLPATGSEMNSGGVITYHHGKYPFGSPLAFPKFSIVDPTVTYSLPPRQVANGVVDTFVHIMEQYATYPAEGRFQDRTSEGVLRTMIEIGRKTIDDSTDYDLRANLVWCASMGLNGLVATGVPQDWSTHMLGHELTAMFGIDHGQSLAILLPHVLNNLREQKREKLLQYADRVWDIREGSEEGRIDLAIQKTKDFFESLGIKTKLSDYGVTADKIEDLVKALEEHGQTALSESRKCTLDVSRKIYQDAL